MDKIYDTCPHCGGALDHCETCHEVVLPGQRFCCGLCERLGDKLEKYHKRRDHCCEEAVYEQGRI